MVICADTSFLFSLYGNDSHTPKALAWCARNTRPIAISTFNRFELLNALRFAEGRKFLAKGQAASSSKLFSDAIDAGRLLMPVTNIADILEEASQMSETHTLTGGHRGFDVLHVAAARIMGATEFLTFDGNQKRLATKEGLKVSI